MNFKHRSSCRGCNSKNIVLILDLGLMPLAGGFVTPQEIKDEIKIPLKLYFCESCKLVQILDIVNPDILFKDYKYISSIIPSLASHFKRYTTFLKKYYLIEGKSSLLEFGCNDGVLLRNFNNNKKIFAIGVDPSKNVSEMAVKNGCKVINGYFNKKSAQTILKKYKKMDVVTGSNVFAHTDNIKEIIEASKILLKPNGVLIIENHYLKSLIDKMQFDTVYHEHLCYYSITSLRNIFESEGMKIIDVMKLKMHGGSIRVIATFKESKLQVNGSVNNYISKEGRINSLPQLLKFKDKCEKYKKNINAFLSNLKQNNKQIVGYGAPGRGTIFLNYCDINIDTLPYTVDISPLRVGKLMPGVHIPIFHTSRLQTNPPDYVLMLAWNYSESIIQQEKNLLDRGVKFVIPLPAIRVV